MKARHSKALGAIFAFLVVSSFAGIGVMLRAVDREVRSTRLLARGEAVLEGLEPDQEGRLRFLGDFGSISFSQVASGFKGVSFRFRSDDIIRSGELSFSTIDGNGRPETVRKSFTYGGGREEIFRFVLDPNKNISSIRVALSGEVGLAIEGLHAVYLTRHARLLDAALSATVKGLAVFLIPGVSVLCYLFLLRSRKAGLGVLDTMDMMLESLDRFVAARNLYIATALVFCLAILAKANMSSLGMWETIVQTKSESTYLLAGEPRPVRSDEWLVVTPWIAAQCTAGFPVVNPNIGLNGQNMLITGAPVLHPIALFQPLNWGYFLFGFERGLSWYWFGGFAILLLGSFELFRIISGGRTKLSLLFSFVIVISAPVQWWSGLFWIGFFQFGIAGFIRYFRSDALSRRLGWGVVTVGGFGAFGLSLYPPFVIPAIYLAFTIITVATAHEKLYKRLRPMDALLIPGLLAVLATAAYLFLRDIGEPLAVMGQTVYPGKRISHGGDISFSYLGYFLTNPFIAWRLPPMLNQSEVAMFLPLAVPAAAYTIGRRARNPYLLPILGYVGVAYFYCFIGIPGIVARATLLSMAPGSRVFLVAGLGGMYAAAAALADMSAAGGAGTGPIRPARWARMILGAAIFGALILLGLSEPYRTYGAGFSLVAAIGYGLLALSLISGWRNPAVALLFACALFSGWSANPVGLGGAPLTQNDIAKKIRAIESRDPTALWLATDGAPMAILAQANGAHAVGGISYYPDLPLWRGLDPEGMYSEVYNRYAHVNISLTPASASFSLVAPDAFRVDFPVSALSRLGVRYLLTRLGPRHVEGLGLQATVLAEWPADSVVLYELHY